MPPLKWFGVVCTFLGLLGFTLYPSRSEVQDDHKEFYELVALIRDIAAGKTAAVTESAIGARAGLVSGGRLVNLREVATGELTSVVLGDTSYHGVMIQAQTNPSEEMGFVLLKTVKSDTSKVRFHSVVFQKDSVGVYKILFWHVSGSE